MISAGDVARAAFGFAITVTLGLALPRRPARAARVALAREFGATLAADDGAALRQLQAVGSRAGRRVASVAPVRPAVASAAPVAVNEGAPPPTPPEVTMLLRGYLERPEISSAAEDVRRLLGSATPEAVVAIVVAMNSNRRLDDEDARVREAMMDYLTNDPATHAVEVARAFKNVKTQKYYGPERDALKTLGGSLVARAKSRARPVD